VEPRGRGVGRVSMWGMRQLLNQLFNESMVIE